MLSLVGGAVGLLLAGGALAWFIHARHDMNRVESIHFDGVIAAFTVFAGVLAVVSWRERRWAKANGR